MAERRRAATRTLRTILDVDRSRSADARRATYVMPYGLKNAIVRFLGCKKKIVVAVDTPGITPDPGTTVTVIAPEGDRNFIAIVAPALGGGGSFPIESQDESVPAPVTSLENPLIALRVISAAGGSYTFDIASFDGAAHVETLHTGIVIPGVPASTDVDGAISNLYQARTVVGVTGIPDGSLFLRTADATLTPHVAQVHTVNIETGEVVSRTFAPTQVGGETNQNRVHRGFEFLGAEFFCLFVNIDQPLDDPTFQLAKFPADLSGQTILNSQEPHIDFFTGGIGRLTTFFPGDALLFHGDGDKAGYSGSFAEGFVPPFGPLPGVGAGIHPHVLGLSGSKYWTVGAFTSTGNHIGLFTIDSLADAAANGWADVGLPASTAFYQNIGTNQSAGYDWNRDRSVIVGHPISTDDLTPGTRGTLQLPITATTWDDATFTAMETGTFQPDMVVADNRAV